MKLFRLLKKTHRHIEKYKVASLEIENIDYVIYEFISIILKKDQCFYVFKFITSLDRNDV